VKGVDFYRLATSCTGLSTTVKIEFYDTAGCEQFRAFSQFVFRFWPSHFVLCDVCGAAVLRSYLRGANAALLCFDLSRPDTFKSLREFYQDLSKYNADMRDVKCFVVGCKKVLDILTFGQWKNYLFLQDGLHVAHDVAERAWDFAREIGAIGYYTTSSRDPKGLAPLHYRGGVVFPRAVGGPKRRGQSASYFNWCFFTCCTRADGGGGVYELFTLVAEHLYEQALNDAAAADYKPVEGAWRCLPEAWFLTQLFFSRALRSNPGPGRQTSSGLPLHGALVRGWGCTVFAVTVSISAAL